MLSYGRWNSEWKQSLERFKSDLEKQSGKPVDKLISDMTRYSQLGNKFSALDTAFEAVEKAHLTKKITELTKALKDFDAGIKSAAANSKSAKDKAKQSGDALKKTIRGIDKIFDTLCEKMDALIANAESAYAEYDKDLAHLNNKWSLFTSKQSRDQKEWMKFRQMVKKHLQSEIKSALLWIKEQEQNPDAGTFNDGVEKETYNIFRYMNEFRGKCEDGSSDFREVEAALAPVEKWRISKTVPANAGGDKVIVALANLKRILAGVLSWTNQL